METVVQIKNLPNYFVHREGYVFKISQGREVRVETRTKQRSKLVLVLINGVWCELLNIILKYFVIEYTPLDRLKYTITDDLKIPVSSIKIKRFAPKHGLSDNEEKMLMKFGCNAKANSANQRCIEHITPLQVYYSLKIHGFKCVYCGDGLSYKLWHLDHFLSLARGGKNLFENVVPTCPLCNTMKTYLDGHQFVKMCKKIAENHFYNLPHEDNPPPKNSKPNAEIENPNFHIVT